MPRRCSIPSDETRVTILHMSYRRYRRGRGDASGVCSSLCSIASFVWFGIHTIRTSATCHLFATGLGFRSNETGFAPPPRFQVQPSAATCTCCTPDPSNGHGGFEPSCATKCTCCTPDLSTRWDTFNKLHRPIRRMGMKGLRAV